MTLVPSSAQKRPWMSSASRGSRYWPTTSLGATHTIPLHIPHPTPLNLPPNTDTHTPSTSPTPSSVHLISILLISQATLSEYQVRGLWWYTAMVYSHHLQIHLFIIPKSILRALWWSFMDICRGMKILHFWCHITRWYTPCALFQLSYCNGVVFSATFFAFLCVVFVLLCFVF